MARVNLRAAFMAGVNSPVTAQQVFTDRADEVSAFQAALANLERGLDRASASPVVDRTQGRRNVLCFYGVGGIGKTTLSQELERRLLADAVAEDRGDVATVRIDVVDDSATDMESLLLRLRAGLGRLGRRWFAFDLALSCYWMRAHPGEELREFLDASPVLRRAAKAVGLGEQIASNVEFLSPVEVGGLPGLAQRAGLGIYRAIRDRVREGTLLSECDLLRELVDADADYEALSYFPYLLAWDLERLPRRGGRRPRVCLFIDTFEALADRPDETAERLVQRCVYLMPNVLFVITGRNRIDWADRARRGELDFVGRDCWPNLHFSNGVDEPRQHLVGYLSDSDADSYLREALTRQGEPAIPADIRQRVIAGGQGLPLYLDLSVSHFVELLARGSEPSADDFGGSFTAVATRSIRDLPREERDLVRTAALVDRFDAGLLRSGQPGFPDGVVMRFLQRPFLMRDDAYELPYALHLALRGAIGDADGAMHDGWSDRDRVEVAGRLLHGLGQRVKPGTDRSSGAQTLEAGVKLAGAHGIFDDWLAQATEQLAEAGQWTSFGGWFTEDTRATPQLQALDAAVTGVVLRRSGNAHQAVTVLEDAGALVDADSAVGQLVRMHLAHALRNTGDYTKAADLYRGLLGTRFNDVARYWLSDHDYLNGRFATAWADLQAWRGRMPAEEGERLRLIGHISRVNALFDQAADTYRAAIDLARGEGLAAAEAKALTNLAQTLCWGGDADIVADTAVPARQLLDLVPNPVELVKLRSAEAVAAAIDGDHDVARAAVDDTRRLADEIGYRGGHNLADVASILLDVRTGDHASARATLYDLDQRTRASGGNTYWVPITASWIDGIAPDELDWPEVAWLDDADVTLRRWARVAG
jgi:tetratricopeptide (TPR) repeat protein